MNPQNPQNSPAQTVRPTGSRFARWVVLIGAVCTAVAAYVISATAAVGTVHNGSTTQATKTWNGKNGAEYADQTGCPSADGAYWLFILTPGGNKLVSGTLSVTFKGGGSVVSTGYFPGKGTGSLHFDVTSLHPAAIKSAVATFTFNGSSPEKIVLTISHAYCTPGTSSSSVPVSSSSVPVSSTPVSTPVTTPVTTPVSTPRSSPKSTS